MPRPSVISQAPALTAAAQKTASPTQSRADRPAAACRPRLDGRRSAGPAGAVVPERAASDGSDGSEVPVGTGVPVGTRTAETSSPPVTGGDGRPGSPGPPATGGPVPAPQKTRSPYGAMASG